MGFITTFSVYNDGCDQLQKYPEEFAKIVYEGCLIGYAERIGTNQVGLGNHANLITVQRTRHADSHTLYLHAGNIVTDLREIKEKDDPQLDNAIRELEYQLERLKFLKKTGST